MAEYDKWEKRHRASMVRYQKKVAALYDAASRELSKLGIGLDTELKDREVFSFDKYPQVKSKADALIKSLHDNITLTITNGIEMQWALANGKNDALVGKVLGDVTKTLPAALKRRYYNNNHTALEAFLARKENGLTLSDRVWRYANQFKDEIELGLDVGIREGLSAARMTKDVKQYLQHPDKLFRRVRDAHNNLVPSKAMRAFHPGQGVYRSSYKNALRLTVTETNMAYRNADHERYQQLDFIVGIRVVLSNNHPVPDICDELSAPAGSKNTSGRGCYPKDFVFIGWHPFCRCHVESILKTMKEIAADTKRIINGKEPATSSVNEVKDVPKEFKDWLVDNKDRIESAKALPYFIKDNALVIDNILDPKAKKKTAIMRDVHNADKSFSFHNELNFVGLLERWGVVALPKV